MKDFNNNYEGKSFTIEVTHNGYILINGALFDSWKKLQCEDFQSLVTALAKVVGLITVGEKVKAEVV